MLVLNRKEGEELRIGKDIVLKVISVSDGTVKIGIEAPKELPILRGELYQNVKENVIEASKGSVNKIQQVKKFEINKLTDNNNE